MKRILHCSFLLAIIIATLLQCNKAEDEPSPGNANATITDEQRMVILEDCRTKAMELNNLVGPDDRVQFLAWLLTQPHFSAAGFAEEDLYAVFNDDRVAFFMHTPLNDSTGRIRSGGGRISETRDAMARTGDFPKTKKVSLFSGLGQYFSESRLGIEQAFSKVITQYQLSYLDASIENLKAVSGDAVFYINTHGGSGTIPLRRSNRTSHVMSLYTTDPCNEANDARYKADIDSLNLTYVLATSNTALLEWHYGITHYFIKNYMSFGENGLVYFDGCNTFSNLNGAKEMRDQVLSKSANGMATYIGWTKTSYHDVAQKAAHFIFERLLGNVASETPIQRPFELARVFEDLHDRGMDVNSLGARLTYQTTNPDEILLAPTIDSLDVDEFSNTLIIYGLFGHDKGTVTVDGFNVEVKTWNHLYVICKMPETGLGSAGDVVVLSSLGHHSNAVPLTEWVIKLDYSRNDNGIKFFGQCYLAIRADIHPRRMKPHETPTKPTHPDYSPASGRFFKAADSYATYNIAGRKFERCDIERCVYQNTESPTLKSGRLTFSNTDAGDVGVFAFYNWGPEMKTLQISHLAIGAAPVPCMLETRINCPDKPETVVPTENPYKGAFSIPGAAIQQVIEMQVAENYNIRNGRLHKSIPNPWGYCTPGVLEETVEWEVVRAGFAPSETTPARIADGD